MLDAIKALIEDFSWEALIALIEDVMVKVFGFVAEEEELPYEPIVK